MTQRRGPATRNYMTFHYRRTHHARSSPAGQSDQSRILRLCISAAAVSTNGVPACVLKISARSSKSSSFKEMMDASIWARRLRARSPWSACRLIRVLSMQPPYQDRRANSTRGINRCALSGRTTNAMHSHSLENARLSARFQDAAFHRDVPFKDAGLRQRRSGRPVCWHHVDRNPCGTIIAKGR